MGWTLRILRFHAHFCQFISLFRPAVETVKTFKSRPILRPQIPTVLSNR